ncbi:MAG: anthranilate phosphoribosyltransferase, partial [Verrucomicrobiota bacterium]
ADFGLETALTPERLLGGDAQANASRIMAILSNQEDGAALDMILLNAAAALHVAGRASSLPAAAGLARESISSGRALRSLKLLQEASASAAR